MSIIRLAGISNPYLDSKNEQYLPKQSLSYEVILRAHLCPHDHGINVPVHQCIAVEVLVRELNRLSGECISRFTIVLGHEHQIGEITVQL
jgi:hypothetical protein